MKKVEKKRCPRCKKTKALSEYHIQTRTQKPQTYCKPCAKAYRREWMQRNPESGQKARTKYYYKYRDKELESDRRELRRIRQQFVNEYGKVCACCGESNIEFLTLDHVNGDGEAHRKFIDPTPKRGANSREVLRRLRREGWPKEGYRILCYNCNFSRGFYGYCPHKEKREWLT